MSHTKFNLQRFLDAQEGVYPVALKEIRMAVSAAIGFGISSLSRRGWAIVTTRSFMDWTGKKKPGLIWHILYWVLVCGKSPMPC